MAPITGLAHLTNGGGFPNRRSEFESEFGLILQDLHRQYSPRGHIFASYSAPKAYQENPENCAKLLKANAGEVAEWLNAAVC